MIRIKEQEEEKQSRQVKEGRIKRKEEIKIKKKKG